MLVSSNKQGSLSRNLERLRASQELPCALVQILEVDLVAHSVEKQGCSGSHGHFKLRTPRHACLKVKAEWVFGAMFPSSVRLYK